MVEDASIAAKRRFIGDPSFVYERLEMSEGQGGAAEGEVGVSGIDTVP